MSVTVLSCSASAISLSKLKENADADELRPGPVPHECELLCAAVQAVDIGRRALLHTRMMVFRSPINLVPPSGFGSRTRTVTSRWGGHPSFSSHTANMSVMARTAWSDRWMNCRGWRPDWPTADRSGKVTNTLRSPATVIGSNKGHTSASCGSSGSPSP